MSGFSEYSFDRSLCLLLMLNTAQNFHLGLHRLFPGSQLDEFEFSMELHFSFDKLARAAMNLAICAVGTLLVTVNITDRKFGQIVGWT